jgi:hypothetical protein
MPERLTRKRIRRLFTVETTIKLVRAVADEDGNLKVNDGTNRTIGQAFRGCRVLAVYPGGSSNQVCFVLAVSNSRTAEVLFEF